MLVPIVLCALILVVAFTVVPELAVYACLLCVAVGGVAFYLRAKARLREAREEAAELEALRAAAREVSAEPVLRAEPEASAEPRTVTCPNCGQQNRVRLAEGKGKRPICGSCKEPLVS